ncbi:MAG: light-harvesting antenna LH1, beta subunit [Beijerinckiaceae bacterium]|nr:light-harvesting antenna LH1, beta subunit [Beijerinckiaceae bacterium]
MADRQGSLTGLTDEEAREFHGFFMTSFIGFTVVAVIAHFLVWMWRPWFPSVKGYASLQDSVTTAASALVNLIT